MAVKMIKVSMAAVVVAAMLVLMTSPVRAGESGWRTGAKRAA